MYVHLQRIRGFTEEYVMYECTIVGSAVPAAPTWVKIEKREKIQRAGNGAGERGSRRRENTVLF
jgi:hypothetical protein